MFHVTLIFKVSSRIERETLPQNNQPPKKTNKQRRKSQKTCIIISMFLNL